jgi:DNA polymerase-3 subunit gamma/tau
MSYQVLARKWRPRTFAELVGQEHVQKALINALDNDRLHHAFLFTGTRGVGKTTIARILAKSLNCEKGVSSQPCGVCSACTEINEGRFVDLIEVDAASRTKVDETRELLDNVQYAPTRGRYKVYLIDEVHMFSNHSFNALLKTLEEPPPHVKFLLATTDPQKLPVTILSRCLQFNLKRLPLEQIRGHLERVLTEEGIGFDEAGLTQISRAADGSMRDALSLLDQAIAFGGGQVGGEEVRAMLGSIEQHHVIDLLKLLAAQDAPGLLARIGQLAEQSPDFGGVLAEMISTLHRIALAQKVSDAVDDSYGDREAVLSLANSLSPEDVQLYYQIALLGRRDLPLAPEPRTGFEMVLLRMLAFKPAETGQGAVADTPSPATTSPASQTSAVAMAKSALSTSMNKTPTASTATPSVSMQADTAPAQSPAPATANPPVDTSDWEALVGALKLVGLNHQLAINCALKQRDGNHFRLSLAKSHEHLLGKKREDALQQALSDYLGEKVTVGFDVEAAGAESAMSDTPAARQQQRQDERQRQAEAAIQQDAAVQAFQETFGAQVNPDTIQPID